MGKKPVSREDHMKVAGAEHDKLVFEYESALPRHPRAGEWLFHNPVEGVTAADRQDGLGPRLLDWPEKKKFPDFDKFFDKFDQEQAEAEMSKALEAEMETQSVSQLQETIKDLTARIAKLEG
jgi:hypothetical protein